MTAAKLTSTLRTGTVTLPLTAARELSAGAYINTAGDAGVLAVNTTPTLTFNNGGSRLTWAATNVDVVSWNTFAPADLDDTADVVVHLITSMSDVNDTPTIAVNFVEGMSNTNVGGNTAAVSGTTPTEKTVTILAADIAGGKQWTINLTPAAHGTDELRVDAVWITYTRK